MKLTTIAVLCIALPISSCSLTGSVDQPLDSAPPSAERLIKPQILVQTDPQSLIARDFVNVLSQMDGMQADATTVAVLTSDRQDDFTLAVHDALEEAGYGIRWVEEGGVGPLFQYRKDKEQAAGGVYRDTYELAVGSIEMRRGYASDSQRRVRPVTPLYVRGADASNIVLNETLFDLDAADASIDTTSGTTTGATGGTTTATTVGPISNDRTSAQTSKAQIQTAGIDAVSNAANARNHTNASPTLALQNSSRLQVPDDANPLNPLVARAAAAPSVSLPLLVPPSSQNVFDLGGSNFQNLLTEHEVVKEQILTFANDSMRLGQLNKQLINQLVDAFDPETDMFSVIGCSMGPTAVEGGNAALALGRADRVVDALRFAGVESKQILDEGCWAGDGSLESLPRRGVVLTLNRRG